MVPRIAIVQPIFTMEADKVQHGDDSPETPLEYNEKSGFSEKHPEVTAVLEDTQDSPLKVYVPDDNDEFIDPRLKDYPIPLVAKCVDLHVSRKSLP